ncbi:MAG: GspH/FimT family pseudopilin [Burkholderiales bacterium]|nr:GspH/FimT family pseudopilin [Burkholderiales bacterium]
MKGEGEKRRERSQAALHSPTLFKNWGGPVHPSPFTLHPSLRTERGRGFTLIEMLVVMLIMGLLVGLVATITRPDDRALLRVEAERLAQLLDLAAAESRLTGKPIAWTTDGLDYRFWRFQEDTGWSEILDSDPLRARMLPQGITISGLQIETMRPQGSMRLEFTPYGSMLAFNVEMSLGAERSVIAASPVGDVRVMPDEGKTHAGMAPR